jgi:hypothetical protein
MTKRPTTPKTKNKQGKSYASRPEPYVGNMATTDTTVSQVWVQDVKVGGGDCGCTDNHLTRTCRWCIVP